MTNTINTEAFHIVYREGEPHLPERITTDLNVAQEAMNTSKVQVNLGPTEALFAAENAPLDRIMDDKTWRAIAPHMDDLLEKLRASHSKTQVPTFTTTPSDLPPVIAEARYDLMRRQPKIEDIPAITECVEIIMAAESHRPVNRDLFSAESRTAPLWDSEIAQITPAELDKEIDTLEEQLGEMRAEASSETAAFGDASPGAYRIIERFNHALFELNYQKAELEQLEPEALNTPGAQ